MAGIGQTSLLNDLNTMDTNQQSSSSHTMTGSELESQTTGWNPHPSGDSQLTASQSSESLSMAHSESEAEFNLNSKVEPLPKLTPINYIIGGIGVEFPTKAYPSQLGMMSKVIQGLKHRKNCLLESPTGSGKSLALLCASLAWLKHEAVHVREYNAAIDERIAEQEAKEFQKQMLAARPLQAIKDSQKYELTVPQAGKFVLELDIQPPTPDFPSEKWPVFDIDDDDDDDFKTPRRDSRKSLESTTQITANSARKNTEPANKTTVEVTPEANEAHNDVELSTKKIAVPRIFFGTRTHKQIAQIMRELRKTPYKNVRSTILSSRENSCINPIVMRMPNKNEGCKELLEVGGSGGSGCGFHREAKRLGNFEILPSLGVSPGFDLEDLVQAGRGMKACPYYAARQMMAFADIVFCPYNYLIDPIIRKSMNIDLSQQIVIFDEGHNLEDAAREAASFTLVYDAIKEAIQDIEIVGKVGIKADPTALVYSGVADFVSRISGWILQSCNELVNMDYDNSGKTYTGTQFVASAYNLGLNRKFCDRTQELFKTIMTEREQQLEKAKERGSRGAPMKAYLSSASIYVCEQLFRMFDYLLRDSGLQRDDFRIALRKAIKRRRTEARGGGMLHGTEVTLSFWCLNPAVEFREVAQSTRCIILTSGTLAPTSSFQSELGTLFPIKLDASHVVDPSQIWAGVIAQGPMDYSLSGAFKNTECFFYQDNIGRIVYDICKTLPHGVLCFFPSYRMLELMVNRWQLSGEWEKISQVKYVYIEPRSNAAEFDDVMSKYYRCILDHENYTTGITGALFLAVFRGKVSEGLDFADNNARGVICIGIPFPNYGDMQVTQKRAYNDTNKARAGLLSGSEWYEIQAFRAFNQAMGRCIRHKQDWGAIFLVDSRFVQTPRYKDYLSRWIRSSTRVYNNWGRAVEKLTAFSNEMSVLTGSPIKFCDVAESRALDLPAPKETTVAKAVKCFGLAGNRMAKDKD